MNENDRAAWAYRLMHDDTWSAFIREIREDAHRAFAGSDPTEIEVREEAYRQLKAVGKIEAKLGAWERAPRVTEKKGQHRGND